MNSHSVSDVMILAVRQEQSATAKEQEHNEIGISFFLVGATINIILVGAYIIWAIRQWRKSNKNER